MPKATPITDAPTKKVSKGLAVAMFQTMPIPEVIAVPAEVSRLAMVTELASIIPPLQKKIVVKRLRAGCGSWI